VAVWNGAGTNTSNIDIHLERLSEIFVRLARSTVVRINRAWVAESTSSITSYTVKRCSWVCLGRTRTAASSVVKVLHDSVDSLTTNTIRSTVDTFGARCFTRFTTVRKFVAVVSRRTGCTTGIVGWNIVLSCITASFRAVRSIISIIAITYTSSAITVLAAEISTHFSWHCAIVSITGTC